MALITTGATPLALPGGAERVTRTKPPKTPLFQNPLGNPSAWKGRTRHEAIRKKAFGPAQVGKAFNKV